MPSGIAVTPDGKYVYFTGGEPPGGVEIIDTRTNKVVNKVDTGGSEVAFTPDGKHAYVPNTGGNTVSVIETATNKVVATVLVGDEPNGVAVTPDGKHVYVASFTNVSVIDTASNKVVATLPVEEESAPQGVGIIPPPPGVPFLVFNNVALDIAFGGAPNQEDFALQSGFALSSTAPAINPLTQAVTFQAGTFAVTIPPGSFVESTKDQFVFMGVINGAELEVLIEPTGTLRYAFAAKAVRASLTGTQNPAYVTLTIGGDSGATSVTAKISR